MFKLSTKGRYAVRMMIYLANQGDRAPSRKQDIAASEAISPDYVEQILIRLRAAGLVASHRGARGGFTMACDPRTTSVLDVLEATEGALEVAPCSDQHCDREAHCVVQSVWREAADALRRVFSSTLISDLAERVSDLKARQELVYEI